jgi:hypothetical protein
MQALQGTDFWYPTFFHHITLELFTKISDVLPELLQDVDLQTKIHLWFTDDGAPPHFLLAFQKFLNNMFPKRSVDHVDQQHGLLLSQISVH